MLGYIVQSVSLVGAQERVGSLVTSPVRALRVHTRTEERMSVKSSELWWKVKSHKG